MAREGAITDTVLAYLNSISGCKAEKIMGTAVNCGSPDINGCWRGQAFRIEMKSPDHGYKVSVKQKISMRQWTAAGCVCFSAYSLKEVKARINEEKCI